MCICSNCEIIISGIQDIGPGQIAIIAGQIILAYLDDIMLCFSRFDHFLIKATDLNRGFFHAIIPIILGVWGLEIDLNRMLSIYAPGIGHIYLRNNGIPTVFDLEIGIGEGGIAETASEGECYHILIAEISRIPLSQHKILIAGLEIPIAHINAFLIDNIIHITFINTGIVVILSLRKAKLLCIGVRKSIIVLHGRRCMIIFLEGIHDPP